MTDLLPLVNVFTFSISNDGLMVTVMEANITSNDKYTRSSDSGSNISIDGKQSTTESVHGKQSTLGNINSAQSSTTQSAQVSA